MLHGFFQWNMEKRWSFVAAATTFVTFLLYFFFFFFFFSLSPFECLTKEGIDSPFSMANF